MRQAKALIPISLLFLIAMACGGGSHSSPVAASTGPQTATFMGSARTAANGGCSSLSPSHFFSAGPGSLTVTLTQAGAARMQVQVCASSEANHNNCTVPPFALLPVGQSVTAAVRGDRTQIVTLYPEGCGGPNSPPTDPISYTVTVVHPG